MQENFRHLATLEYRNHMIGSTPNNVIKTFLSFLFLSRYLRILLSIKKIA